MSNQRDFYFHHTALIFGKEFSVSFGISTTAVKRKNPNLIFGPKIV